MNSSLEKINSISADITKVRDELLVLQSTLKETLLVDNEMIDNNLLNDILNQLENFKELKIPELTEIVNSGIV